MNTVEIGKFIKEHLKIKGYTQDNLADYLGISKQAVSQNLSGKSSFEISNIMMIAEYLDVTVDNILYAGEKRETLLSKTLTINRYNYEIVGILDTNLDFERYQGINENDTIDAGLSTLLREIEVMTSSGIHSSVFFRTGYYQEVIYPNSYDGSYLIKNQSPLVLKLDKLAIESNYEGTETSFYSFVSEDYIPDNVIWKNGVELDDLGDNQILLPIISIPDDKFIGTIPSFSSQLSTRSLSLVMAFALDHFDEIKDQFIDNPYYEETYEDYADYIYNSTSSGNDYHPGFDRSYFDGEAQIQLLETTYFTAFSDLQISRSYNGDTVVNDIEVVGFFETTTVRGKRITLLFYLINSIINF